VQSDADGITTSSLVEKEKVSRETNPEMQSTYSPEDNKLRLYAVNRLATSLYERVKGAGFTWAPKQKLFVTTWSPERADLLMELCGDIGDEDTSLVDRAEERADRFETYRGKRAADAESARQGVAAIADNIPFGQPILVGHHSERHARRDAERIENGMRKAVKMWETAKYWTSRAAGAIGHAKYKELPEVRARRIKTIEADRRRAVRSLEKCEQFVALWKKLEAPNAAGEPADAALILRRATSIANFDYISQCFPLADFPREAPASQYEGQMSLWSALKDGIITVLQARDIALSVHDRRIGWSQRWMAHYDNRLAYERAMLEEQGASDLIAPKQRKAVKQLPLCNYRAPEGITCESRYRHGENDHYPQVEMTQAEYARISKDYKGTRVVENSHRIRTAMRQMRLVSVFLTDAKVHEKPAAMAPAVIDPPMPRQVRREYRAPERTVFDAMREQLQEGVKVTVAPQLFPTPYELVRRMVEMAEIKPGDHVLEPSAGTGRILEAIQAAGGIATAVEINYELVEGLRSRFDDVRHADFMETHFNAFDAIVMNPPFAGAQDVDHIMHAFSMLKVRGRLVAICANGPRQSARLRGIVEDRGGSWEELPADTFKESGTSVNTVLICVTRAD
jgi:protein-L-isoaspartate O-methyltransferase